MENVNVVSGLIDSLHRLSYQAGRAALAALAPLLRLARSLRDPLILVLRKSLFARSQEARQVTAYSRYGTSRGFLSSWYGTGTWYLLWVEILPHLGLANILCGSVSRVCGPVVVPV